MADYLDVINALLVAVKSRNVDLPNMADAEIVREFRTIHVNAGRRTGKTSWAKQLLEAGTADLLVFPRSMFGPVYNLPRANWPLWGLTGSLEERMRLTGGGQLHGLVIVDEPGLCEVARPGFLNEVYEKVVRGAVVVLLGE